MPVKCMSEMWKEGSGRRFHKPEWWCATTAAIVDKGAYATKCTVGCKGYMPTKKLRSRGLWVWVASAA
jgi:hypothetical protein